MTRKKPAASPKPRGRVTLTSGLVGGTPSPLQPAQPEQPWRHKKPLGKNKGRK